MRGVVMDRRVEAVAGSHASGQVMVFPSYVNTSVPANLDGRLWWRYAQGDVGHWVAGVGRHPLLAPWSGEWRGPMRAVSYGHALTPAQTLAVARRLAATLPSGGGRSSLVYVLAA